MANIEYVIGLDGIKLIHDRLQSQINSLSSGVEGVPSVSDMTETTKVYVNTTDGKWYFYDPTLSQWTPGGVYQANVADSAMSDNSVNAVQNKVVKSYIDEKDAELNGRLEQLEEGGTGTTVPTEVRQAIFTLLDMGAFVQNSGATAPLAVLQAWASAVTAITLNNSTATITGSGTSQLTATTTPAGGAVTWSSSDTSVATVSSGGLVTGVGNGTCRITATSGDKSAYCDITVSGFATLSSISAVYTQSETVYATTSLNDLKTDLVVTGTYSDSSTSTITNYTLSGTLTVGTSTVTVSYGGKTTTFNVTVSSAPPLYTLYQGTTAMSSGNSCTLSDGNHCAAVATTNGRMAYVDQSKGASGAPQNFKTTIFTLSSGDEWEFRIKNIEFASNTSAENYFNLSFYNLDTATPVKTGSIAYSSLNPGTMEDVSVTGTVEEAVNVTSVRFYFHRPCEMEYDFEFYVNGIRYL